MIPFQNLLIELTLFSSNGKFVPSLPVIFQYYSFDEQEWVNLYTASLNTKGHLSIRRTTSTEISPEEAAFFDAIHNDKLPPSRVIPATVYEELDKQPVLGSSFSFRLDAMTETFRIDFGVLWLAPTEFILDSSTRFPDFLPVTSPFKIPAADKTPLPINELYSNIVSEIETASYASGSSPFKLANISLKLKAMLQRDGETVSATLLDPESSENVNGNAISELVFDITSNQQEGSEIIIPMPDLKGLTETAVRRILKSLDLRLNPVYQNKPEVMNGDSFKQSPAIGEKLKPNQLVTVIFSKHEQYK